MAVNSAPLFGTGGNGTVLVVDADPVRAGRAVALQPDGKLLAAGALRVGGNDDLLIERRDAEGRLDTNFGGGDGAIDINNFHGDG